MSFPVRLARILAFVAGTVCVFLLAACSSTWQYVRMPDQKQKVADPFKGRIYVIRMGGTNSAASVDVEDGHRLIGSTRPQGYLCWERRPGQVTVRSSSDGESDVSFNLSAGEVCFIFQRVGPGRFEAESSLEIVNAEEGRAALNDCKPPKLHNLNRGIGPRLGDPTLN
jgi:hypothetical protein